MSESGTAVRTARSLGAGATTPDPPAPLGMGQLVASVTAAIELQAQLNERFAVRLLEFSHSLRAVERSCRNIQVCVEKLSTQRSPRSCASTAWLAKPSGFVPARFDIVHRAPALMTLSERVLLYGLIVGLRPQRCLEIGTHKGGSAQIIVAAMDDLGGGVLACVDPEALIAEADWQTISHRAMLIVAPSPHALPEASRAVGGKFDFALIDGDHSTEGALRDIEGTLPLLEDNAWLLFHDAHHDPVAEAIRRAQHGSGSCLHDCGMLATEISFDPVAKENCGGLHLLQFCRSH